MHWWCSMLLGFKIFTLLGCVFRPSLMNQLCIGSTMIKNGNNDYVIKQFLYFFSNKNVKFLINKYIYEVDLILCNIIPNKNQ